MQDVQKHSSVSKLNNGAIHRKLQSIKLTGKCLFEMLNEMYFSQLRKEICGQEIAQRQTKTFLFLNL